MEAFILNPSELCNLHSLFQKLCMLIPHDMHVTSIRSQNKFHHIVAYFKSLVQRIMDPCCYSILCVRIILKTIDLLTTDISSVGQ